MRSAASGRGTRPCPGHHDEISRLGAACTCMHVDSNSSSPDSTLRGGKTVAAGRGMCQLGGAPCQFGVASRQFGAAGPPYPSVASTCDLASTCS
eukprot:COSAG01_NODE_1821_length_9119_cov_4.375345_7_plen_94_part_00